MKKVNSLKGAKNIGPKILSRLNEIGIYSLADLDKLTSVNAYKKICQQNPDKIVPVCYYLYSLEGALLDVHWNELSNEFKKNLLDKVAS
ncbi:TfoX/Sxy family protein [Acinetobacter bereziniae]|uniref:TfoX C-terminal domain-containing protein n=1 Tax=Acinetobacter bereziniae NIPH 3 TaxID=1217651 RepID=N8XBQ7_ACIBZ|nr:TfoX/Sxy family protein [Acinetobacter bereziniae]ENV21897.1 hypothetical protein F963_02290 [Acinetobacter bereziniae NIPH 3]